MLSFRRFSLAPRVGASQDCRKTFIRARREVPGGAALLMIRSVIVAHVGRVGVKSRYVLSHVISMASFRARMLRRFRPPALMGICRYCKAILGDESSFHMKSRIIFVRAVSIGTGIPCALVRNCVRPPTTAWMMIRLPSKVGLLLLQRSRSFLILSRIGSHGVASLVWLPIHAPRDRIASPSSAMCMRGSKGSLSCWLIFQVVATRNL